MKDLKHTEELCSVIQPEIIDLCLSPQEGPEKVAATPEMAVSPFVEITSPPDDKARVPCLIYTSPMNGTQLMFETAMTEECITTASQQTLKQRMENNVKIIRKARRGARYTHGTDSREDHGALKLCFENFLTLNLFPPLNQVRLIFPYLTCRFLAGAKKNWTDCD